MITPLASFGPDTDVVNTLGWYHSGNVNSKTFLFEIRVADGASLQPNVEPPSQLEFDPGTGLFSFYTTWPFYNNHTVLQEDYLNHFPGKKRCGFFRWPGFYRRWSTTT